MADTWRTVTPNTSSSASFDVYKTSEWWLLLSSALWFNDRHPALAAQPSWRDVVVAPELRCSPYNVDDYRYPLSVKVETTPPAGKT